MIGVWVAYHSDWSGFALFDLELECLRYAVANSMAVAQVPFGKDVRQEVTRQWRDGGGR